MGQSENMAQVIRDFVASMFRDFTRHPSQVVIGESADGEPSHTLADVSAGATKPRVDSLQGLTGEVALVDEEDDAYAMDGQKVVIPRANGNGVDPARETFFNEAEWVMVHNLGTRAPMITVWEDVDLEGFGVQAFGTSPFGGDPGERHLATAPPTQGLQDVEIVDENTVRVEWSNERDGELVVIG